jgi:hypothetical protein
LPIARRRLSCRELRFHLDFVGFDRNCFNCFFFFGGLGKRIFCFSLRCDGGCEFLQLGRKERERTKKTLSVKRVDDKKLKIHEMKE